MRPTHRLAAKIAAVALVAAGSLIALQPGASAAPTHAMTSVSTQSAAAVTGSVTIRLSVGGSITIPGAQLSVGTTVDTGVQVSAVSAVTNNTDATLEFSGGGSASITVAPGISADVSALGSGTLKITVDQDVF
ncbi:hypothetical protein [Streptomyces aurantiogriseus]|uniref:Uncharacterized protein n=1 Tax=Streptomyces aurantiogriseus TaxID=66870 RepID=A0A918FJV6_9ACTN|nr:hypothetical protein [Streptomyces aurantiogriseus]GGR43396.1 hypothetical protein GCM10010251_70560 [Streptomyces aurantiogriseus]